MPTTRTHHGARRRTATSTATAHGTPKESPWVVTVPLVLLAIPSVYRRLDRTSSRCCSAAYFGDSIVVLPAARRAGAS